MVAKLNAEIRKVVERRYQEPARRARHEAFSSTPEEFDAF